MPPRLLSDPPPASQTSACGEKPIYISESAPGGCEQTCVAGERNFMGKGRGEDEFVFDPNKICSDGGEGSVRVPFLLPPQVGRPLQGVPANFEHVSYTAAYPPLVYWDFACEFLTSKPLCITHEADAHTCCCPKRRVWDSVLSVWSKRA